MELPLTICSNSLLVDVCDINDCVKLNGPVLCSYQIFNDVLDFKQEALSVVNKRVADQETY
jgi:hypothetical protein